MVWKLAAYGLADKADWSSFLNIPQILFSLNKKYSLEFRKGVRSFFQQILCKDNQPSVHWVGVIAAIKRVGINSIILVISDGAYCLNAPVIEIAKK